MADPVLGLGPNLNAYRAALQRANQNQQMVKKLNNHFVKKKQSFRSKIH